MDTSDPSKANTGAKETDPSKPGKKKKTPKQAKENQPSSCQPEQSVSLGLQSLPEVKFESNEADTGSPVKKTKKAKVPLILVENSAASDSESLPEVGNQSSPAKGKSPKKLMKSSLPANIREDVRISGAESLPEVRVQAKGSARKGRVVPSRYKESAKGRAVATPTKMSESSCISINQSKLFSTATSSTPVSAGGKVQDVSVRPKQPPKMASLDASIRPKQPKAAALPVKDKAVPKVKKASKTATVKVKPMRATDPAAKTQAGGDADRLSDHQLLYNQYLQWTYLCRMSEASIRKELPQLSFQARQLSGLVDGARHNSMELERKLQAVTLYREMAQLERQLTDVLAAINASADTVRGDLSRMTTTLDATRNRLQLKGFVEPTDVGRFVEDLVSAAERCRDAVGALDTAVSPHANLLRHTAESVGSLQQALEDGAQHMARSDEMVQELGSLALQEASLSVGSSAQQETSLSLGGSSRQDASLAVSSAAQ